MISIYNRQFLLIFIFIVSILNLHALTGTSSERASTAAVSPTYPVTPGDTYNLRYSDESATRSMEIIVDRNFIAQIPGFRQFNAQGLTYYELKGQVEELFNELYPGSVPVFTISNPGVFDVLIKGEVSVSQELPAWSFERLSTLIESISTPYTSSRRIEIISSNGKSRFVDIFKARRTGEMSQDPYLSFGDTIILYPYEKQVTLNGQVRRPGTYQLNKDETLVDLIQFQGGGFTPIAEYTQIEVKRPLNSNNYEGNTFYMDMSVPGATMELMNMDVITVTEKTSYLPIVSIQGAIGDTSEGTTVSSKVDISITEDEKLSSVVRKIEDQFTKVSDLEKAYIVRSNGENIPCNIQELLLSGKSEYDVVLHDRDIIVIPFRQYYVYVSGEVNDPGSYPYIVNKTWEYYVNLAGGFNIDTHTGRKVKIYDVYGEKYKPKDRILQPEDVIFVPRNHPMYWIGRYGTDISLLISTLTTSIILYNYMSNSTIAAP